MPEIIQLLTKYRNEALTITFIIQARTHIKNQEHSKAIICFEDVLKADPLSLEAHLGLGKLYMGKKQYQLALLHIERSLMIDANNKIALKLKDQIKPQVTKSNLNLLRDINNTETKLLKSQQTIKSTTNVIGLCTTVTQRIKQPKNSQKYFQELLNILRTQEVDFSIVNKEEMLQHKKEIKDLKKMVNLLQKKVEEQKVVNIDRLIRRQKILLNYYYKQQLVLHQKKYIDKHPTLLAFYRRIQQKMSELFLACAVINSEMIERAEDKTSKGIKFSKKGTKMVIKLGGQALNFIPGVGFAAGALDKVIGIGGKLVNEVHKKREIVIIKKISELTASLTEMDALVEKVARRLTFRYEQQIRCLTIATSKKSLPNKILKKTQLISDKDNGGVENLAECAVARMLTAMRSGQIKFENPEKLVDQLVDVVFFAKTSHKSILSLFKKMKIATREELNIKKWNPRGIFQKTGLRTKKGKFFHGIKKMKCNRPEKYGYRLGSEEEARDLELRNQENYEKIENKVDKNVTRIFRKPTQEEMITAEEQTYKI